MGIDELLGVRVTEEGEVLDEEGGEGRPGAACVAIGFWK